MDGPVFVNCVIVLKQKHLIEMQQIHQQTHRRDEPINTSPFSLILVKTTDFIIRKDINRIAIIISFHLIL